MYKSKLQEICQKRSWSLPKYTTTKHGLDHIPSFSSTVLVNDMSFHTLTPSNSSKNSQNDAAKLAVDHFSLPNPTAATNAAATAAATRPSIPPSSSFPQPSLSSGFSSATTDVIVTAHQNVHQTQPPLEANTKFREVQRPYKSELLIYTQKRNTDQPIYKCEREGPPHASRFKCSVTVGGSHFECSEYFPTLKEAEHAAAKVALNSLSPEQDDSGAYKNLLQEMAQKEGSHLPIYNTQRFGELRPVFISSVEVNGGNFLGEEAKTKKQAEISAAKVAYNALKDRDRNSTSNHIPPVLPSQRKVQESPELLPSGVQPKIPDSMQQRVGPKMPMVLNPMSTSMPQTEDTSGIRVTVSSNVLNDSTHEIVSYAEPCKLVNESSSSFLNGSTDSNGDSNIHISSGKITLAYKKICVYPVSKPIPDGSTSLPIHDHNWIAFCPPDPRC